jgi:hypothetical protein
MRSGGFSRFDTPQCATGRNIRQGRPVSMAMAALLAFFLSLFLTTVNDRHVRPVRVAVFAPAKVTDSLVNRICADGRVIADASITIPLEGRALDAKGIAGDVHLSKLLTSALEALAQSTRTGRTP